MESPHQYFVIIYLLVIVKCEVNGILQGETNVEGIRQDKQHHKLEFLLRLLIPEYRLTLSLLLICSEVCVRVCFGCKGEIGKRRYSKGENG